MKKTFVLLATLLCLAITLSLPFAASAPTYLFITGVENDIDDLLVERIKSLGFDVAVKSHEDFDASADSVGKIAIYISESVSSGNIVDNFNNIAIPIVTSEAYIYDDMGLTYESAETDFGSNTENIIGKVIKPDHPIMKGVSAEFKVVTNDDLDPPPNFCWGIVPSNNALAVEPDNPDHAVIFAYEKGEKSMDGMNPVYTFPEKRAAIALHTTFQPEFISADMWKIFDNSIIWAAGLDPLAKALENDNPDKSNPASSDKNMIFYYFSAVSILCFLIVKKIKTKTAKS